MKKLKRLLALMLALVLTASVFTACGEPNGENETQSAITATAVKFAKSGKYTTTVTSDKVDLSGITAENIKVRYSDPNDALTVENFANQIAINTSAKAETEENEEDSVSIDEQYPLTAKVKSVKTNDEKGYDITFTDENAADYTTQNYVINFDGKEETANVSVDFPEITLTSDTEFVTPSQKDIKLTLSIAGSEFKDEITEADISIGSCFDRMEKKVISSSKNNLTLDLKGNVVKNEAGTYQWGEVSVKRSAIKDGYEDVTAKIEIKLDTVYLDASSMKCKDGKVTADLKAYGLVDVKKLTKDNVKLDGVTTDAVKKVDDSTARVTFSAEKLNSVNDFVDLVGGKAFEAGDYKTKLGLSQASMYPVFDYVEEDGDNLKLTLKLYSGSGTFDKSLNEKALSFADDFKDAEIKSLKVDSDNIATLVISIPANGATAENLKLNGTVTLAKGSVINEWGEKTSKPSSYTRDYSGESLGREVTLNGDTLLEIQKYTRGLNTLFGKVCYYGGVAGQVYSIGKTVLEAAGVLQSDQEKIMEQFANLNRKMDKVIDNQYVMMEMLDKIDADVIESANESYRENIKELKRNVNIMEELVKTGALKMALEKAVEEGKIDKMPRVDDYDNYTSYLPQVAEMSDKELEDYNNELMDYLEDQSKKSHDTTFNDYDEAYKAMKTALGRVADKLSETGSTNPIVRYDKLCSLKYNFDSQCYEFRCHQRNIALDLLTRATMILFAHEKVMSNTKDVTYVNYMKSVEPAANWVSDSYNDIGHPAQDIEGVGEYISDLMVAGMNTADPDKVKELLLDKGYTPYDVDLNQGTNGSKIYLGYKTTTNKNEAIKNLIVKIKTEASDTVKQGDKTYSLCSFVGDEAFVNSKGNLNHGVTYKTLVVSRYGRKYTEKSADSIILYYTKDGDEKNAVTNIYFDGNYDGSIVDANGGANFSGTRLYMHSSTEVTQKTKGVQAFPHMEMKKTGATYISSFALGGDDNAKDAKKALEDNGYTVYDVDLNRKAGGYYIYLGYKTTTSYNAAIKSLFIESHGPLGSSTPNKTQRVSLVPVYGNKKFKDSYGDLNYKAGGNYLFLHQIYSAAAGKDKKAISGYWINGTKPKSGEGIDTDLNKLAGGDDLYLHYEYAYDEVETGVLLESDPEYYPFSYALGKKAAIGTVSEDGSPNAINGAIKKPDGGWRNWTDLEINAFTSRMTHSNVEEEFKSAGLGFHNKLLIDIYWKDKYMYGNVMFKHSKKVDVQDKMTYKNLYDEDLTYLKLFD